MQNPKAFDMHSHVNFAAYDEDRDEVIARAHDAGVWMINVGTERVTSKQAVELAQKYEEGVYATVGLHPIHAGGASYHDKNELKKEEHEQMERTLDETFYRELAQNDKVLAIGECGLDYYRCDESSKEKQKKIFIEQIHLANEIEKPLMLHVRGERGDDTPYKEALEMLKSEAKVAANFHFYAGSLEMAQKIWSIGYTTSFTGVITFARAYEKIIKSAPLEQIMTETDCPYVAPQEYRGRRNEPVYVREVVRKIADIKKENEDTVAQQLVKNAKNFFSIDKPRAKEEI